MTETNRIEFKRELMRVFRDVEMVESLGSGMNRIMRTYGRENFEFGGNYIRMIVPYNWIPEEGESDDGNVVENVPENDLGNVLDNYSKLNERQRNVLKRLMETGQKHVLENGEDVVENVVENSDTLARVLGVSPRTVQRDLAALQELGFIRHDGPDKGGRWIVLIPEKPTK